MTRTYRPWTMRDDEKLEALLRRGLGVTEIAGRMNRARQVIQRKRDGDDASREGKRRRVVEDAGFLMKIPNEVLIERERRAILVPRDFTAAFCGDPLPGQSMLDRRRA